VGHGTLGRVDELLVRVHTPPMTPTVGPRGFIMEIESRVPGTQDCNYFSNDTLGNHLFLKRYFPTIAFIRFTITKTSVSPCWKGVL
jgi:hypothetical protein